jgi:hypothetical protein
VASYVARTDAVKREWLLSDPEHSLNRIRASADAQLQCPNLSTALKNGRFRRLYRRPPFIDRRASRLHFIEEVDRIAGSFMARACMLPVQMKTMRLALDRVFQRIWMLGARRVSGQRSSFARCLGLGLRIPPHTLPPTGRRPATTSPLRGEPELRVPTKPSFQTRRFRWPSRIADPLQRAA